jgi:hypothetical protein
MRYRLIVPLILASALSSVAAQEPRAAPGSRIRATHSCRVADDGSTRCFSLRSGVLRRDTGILVGVRSDTLLLQIAPDRAAVYLPLAAVQRLETPQGRKSRWARGAGIGLLGGAVAGGVIGGVVGASNDPEFAGLYAVVGIALGGAAGFAVGAITGSFFTTDRWVRIPRSEVGAVNARNGGVGYGISVRFSF